MMYLNKILPTILLPILLSIILIILGINSKKNQVIYSVLIALYIISTPIFSNNFVSLIEGREKRITINNIREADAIVVLSGMLEVNIPGNNLNIEWGDPDRFFGGLELYRTNKAPILVFTGGKLPENTKKTEGEFLKEFAISNRIPNENILVTEEVKNTEDEAKAVEKLLPQKSKIILVTSAFHMFRAKLLFENRGLIVIPFKVDYKTGIDNQVTILDFLPTAHNLALSELGIRELLGRLFYLIKN